MLTTSIDAELAEWVDSLAFTTAASRKRRKTRNRMSNEKIDSLEAKLITKNEVIAELMEENVNLGLSQSATPRGDVSSRVQAPPRASAFSSCSSSDLPNRSGRGKIACRRRQPWHRPAARPWHGCDRWLG